MTCNPLRMGLYYRPDFSGEKAAAEEALAQARREIGDTPVVLDYTAAPRILGLARRLLEAGFNVERIFADLFLPAEEADFEFLKSRFPEVRLTPTLHLRMRFAAGEKSPGKILAVGQKAAFFTGSAHFVDLVWGRGFYGFTGLKKIAGLLAEAFRTPREVRSVIQHKGWGCESCL